MDVSNIPNEINEPKDTNSGSFIVTCDTGNINNIRTESPISSYNHITRRMSWFLLITTVIWPFVTLLATIIVFYSTKNPFSLSLFPTLTTPVVAYLILLLKPLLPMNEMRYHLAEKKLDLKKRRIGR